MKRRILSRGKGRSRRRGSILMISIFIIMAMLIMTIPFLIKMAGGNRSTERAARALTAINLAEAGVDKVMWYLNPYAVTSPSDTEAIAWDYSGTDTVGVLSGLRSNDGRVMGDVQVVLTPPVGVAPNPRTRTLAATGVVPFVGGGTVNRNVRCALEQYFKSIFDVGFFVDEYFYIRNSFLLDAYNSNNGAYGAALPGGGTNSLLPDVYFGSNSYISDTNPRDAGDATWTIRSGGGSNEIYGTIMAGGDAAEAYSNGTAANPPDPDLLDTVISVPDEDVFLGDQDRMVMTQEYEMPPVDVYNLPPKEILGSIPSVGDWFNGYNATTPESSSGYYADRFVRAPLSTEIEPAYAKGTFSTATNGSSLTPANNGVYTSFQIGNLKTSGTVNVSGGDVVIYVTSYGDVSKAASFFMGPSSSINIAAGSSLTLILGNASVAVSQGYNINATGSPAQAANCVILGTEQFRVPANQNVSNLPNKVDSVVKLAIPGLMYFEHAQSDGNIYAATYAPGAHLTTGQGQNHMNYFGAFLCKSMDFKVQVDFHYDKALADLKIVKGGYEFWKIVNWSSPIGGI